MKIDFSKVLITGAGGMVGSYADFGVKTDRRSLDVTDLKEVLKVCREHKPQVIIHLAAETDVDRCERDPEYAYMVNGIGAYHMALAAKESGAKLVYVSTAGIFDGAKEKSYMEEDEANPQNYYGRSKHLGELAVKGILKNYIIARVCWMFGGGPQKDQKFVAKIIRQFDKGEIKAVDDQIGSPTFGKDLMGAVKKLIEQDAVGVFNLANKGVCSRYEFAREIVNILNPEIKVTPAKMVDFNLDAPRTFNEGLISKVDLMRPWQEALKEYLETEWEPFVQAIKK
ncbi:MAG: dTDP-4-dehydrorhamnose reductase [Patescibacteria group bacterium]